MTTVSDIFTSAFNKDAVGLKAAVDAVMMDKVSLAVSDLTDDVASSMFGATNGDPEDESVESSDENEQEESSEEEQSDEDL